MAGFWPTKDHWSVAIDEREAHYLCPALEETGFVALRPADFDVPAAEWESLEYMDWKSGGDTNSLPSPALMVSSIAGLLGQGQDRQGRPVDLERRPGAGGTLKAYVDSIGANFPARSASSSSSRRIATPPSAASIATTTTASIRPTRGGSCGRGWS
ncbi:MAG: hypothetical protein R2705_01420 [Ilumatobacteraceae bacterium]